MKLGVRGMVVKGQSRLDVDHNTGLDLPYEL